MHKSRKTGRTKTYREPFYIKTIGANKTTTSSAILGAEQVSFALLTSNERVMRGERNAEDCFK